MIGNKFTPLWPFMALVTAVNVEWAAAQPLASLRLSDNLINKARFQELPQHVVIRVKSAVENYDDNKWQKSAQDLQAIIAMEETKKASSLFRAWVYQWLALNYSALDSSEAARFYVQRSLDEDIDIWPDYLDPVRFSGQFIGICQLCWSEILERFNQKRQSFRVAVGTITRADYSYNYGLLGIVTTGLGTSVRLAGKDQKLDVKFEKDLLLYIRLQQMRKNIERLTAGFYEEFSLSLKRSNSPDKAISFGPTLSYFNKSGWELGGNFEVARLVIGRGATQISQTAFNEEETLSFSYGNFEVYLRKWF